MTEEEESALREHCKKQQQAIGKMGVRIKNLKQTLLTVQAQAAGAMQLDMAELLTANQALLANRHRLQDQIRQLQENLRVSKERINALVAVIDAYEAEAPELRDGSSL